MAIVKSKKTNYRTNKKSIFFLIMPALVVYICLEVIPIIQSLYFAFFKWNGMVTNKLEFVGIKNFIYLFKNEYFSLALRNTLWFVVLSSIVQLTIGFLLAVALASHLRGYKILKSIYFIPMIITFSGISLMWKFILFPKSGPFSKFISAIGLGFLDKPWLADKSTALNSIILVNSWIFIGFYLIIFYSAIVAIDSSLIDSAKIDGSYGINRLFNIIIPSIWNIIKVAIVMQITGNLKVFDIVYVMTGGGPDGLTNTLGTLMYNEAFVYSNFGKGSAVSALIFILSVCITLISLKTMQRDN